MSRSRRQRLTLSAVFAAPSRESHPAAPEQTGAALIDGLGARARPPVSHGPRRRAACEPPPEGVKRQPDERLYRGQRILVRRNVSAGFGPYARLERQSLAFRHQIYCLPLQHVPAWQAKVILGILLSSLGRYRLFMR